MELQPTNTASAVALDSERSPFDPSCSDAPIQASLSLFGITPEAMEAAKQNPASSVTTRNGRMYRVKIKRADAEVIKVKVIEGVISEDRFARVQAEMARTKFNHLKNHPRLAVNFGVGLAICGHCGQPLFCISGNRTELRNKKQGAYQCKSNHYGYKAKLGGCTQQNLRNDQLDDAIEQLANKILSEPEWLEKILEASAQRHKDVIIPIAQAGDPSLQITELKRRDKRVLEAYEAGAISVSELRDRRDAIRKEQEMLIRLSSKNAGKVENDFVKVARQIVKGAHRFSQASDRATKREIIREIFAEIHVRDRYITGFRFREGVFSETTFSPDACSVLLTEPLPVGAALDGVQSGHQRCKHCKATKPHSEFYRKLHVCNPCRKTREKARYLQRRAEQKHQCVAAAEAVNPKKLTQNNNNESS